MIVVDGTKITMTYRDTFSVTFNISGYYIKPEDKIVFSVKNQIPCSPVLLRKEISGIEGTAILVDIPTDEFAQLVGKGNKLYDILLIYGEKKNTLNFPAILIVKDVVNDG